MGVGFVSLGALIKLSIMLVDMRYYRFKITGSTGSSDVGVQLYV